MNILNYIRKTIFSCFQFYDGQEGQGATGSPTKDIDPEGLTMEQLKGVVLEAVKDSTKEEIAELRKEIKKTNQISIFDEELNGGEAASRGGDSVIDTNRFFKQYSTNVPGQYFKYVSIHPALPAGMVLGNELRNIGGPFKKLSPQMETFAKFIKCRGNLNTATIQGLDLKKHNEICKEHYKQAGMSEGILADGGALVPVEFLPTVIEFATAQSQILQKVWQIPMNSNVLRIPRLAQAAGSYFGGITLYSPDEGELKESTKPTLERITLTAKKLIGLVYMTDELIADSMINVVNYVTGLFVRAFQYEIERRVIRGGTAAGVAVGPILGIINDPAINRVARQVAGTIGYLDVINLDSALDENFTNLSWMTRKASQNTLMGLRDSNNRPIYLADYYVFSQEPLHPATMISYPVYRTRNVPAIGNDGDLILGDLSWFLIGMRQDMTIDMSNAPRFEYDEQTIRFVMRLDGMPAISEAFAILTGAES